MSYSKHNVRDTAGVGAAFLATFGLLMDYPRSEPRPYKRTPEDNAATAARRKARKVQRQARKGNR